MSDAPIRMTKQRALALLEILGRGEDEERASIEDTYGVTFLSDGTLDVEAELLEPGELETLTERLATLTAMMQARAIFVRRYT